MELKSCSLVFKGGLEKKKKKPDSIKLNQKTGYMYRPLTRSLSVIVKGLNPTAIKMLVSWKADTLHDKNDWVRNLNFGLRDQCNQPLLWSLLWFAGPSFISCYSGVLNELAYEIEIHRWYYVSREIRNWFNSKSSHYVFEKTQNPSSGVKGGSITNLNYNVFE